MTTSTQSSNQHEELFKSIGRALAKKRESCNLTQEQVSEALQIGTEAVSRMERGITMPTVQRLAELAEIYGCGIDELLIASSNRTSDQAERISQILQATAKVFGVPATSVKVSDIKKDDGFNGTQIFYAASIQGKPFRCGMLSSFAGASVPKCVKPGEPLNM